jgi:hypothetical protein
MWQPRSMTSRRPRILTPDVQQAERTDGRFGAVRIDGTTVSEQTSDVVDALPGPIGCATG